MKTEKVSILLCEDDVNFGMLLKEYLEHRGYTVEWAKDGEEGWNRFRLATYDVCIFDVMMPHKSGLELCRDIRSTGSNIPIIFLSAKNTNEDIIEGYRAGADDYFCKPCSMEIVIYKIESVLRRIRRLIAEDTTEFQLGKYAFDAQRQTLTNNSEHIRLSSREAELLRMLCQAQGALVERSYILKAIWKDESYFSARSLSVYINHLRNRLKGEPEVRIMSVHGKGYKIIIP